MSEEKLDAEHADYAKAKLSWEIMEDVIAGEAAVKEKGEAYLPKTAGMIAHGEIAPAGFKEGDIAWAKRGLTRYEAYKLRAEFPDKTGPACDAAVGFFTDKDAACEVPDAWKPMLDNCTPEADTIWDFHRIVSEKVTRKGRAGIWADVRDGSPTLPYFVCYNAEEIINWSEATLGNERVLDRLVTKICDIRDGKEVYILQIATLKETGVFVERYIKAKNTAAKDDWQPLDTKQPKTARSDMGEALKDESGSAVEGFRLRRIPFQFINSDGLKPCVGRVPFLPLAKQCLAVYRLDAGYKEALAFYEPQFYVTGMTKEWIDQGLAPVYGGVETNWYLPAGATADILEYSGAVVSAQRQAIADAKAAADELSMKPFEPKVVSVESGEAKKERTKTQTSAAKVMAQNIGSGIQKIMRVSADWLGVPSDKIVFEPSYDFNEPVMDGMTLAQYVMAQQAGAFSKTTLHENLQRGGVTEKSFEEEKELIGRGE